jgi:hypothetical protein
VKKAESAPPKAEPDSDLEGVQVVPKKEVKPPSDTKQLTLDAFTSKKSTVTAAAAKPKPPVKKETPPAPTANGSIFDEDDTPLNVLLAKPLTKAAPKEEADSDSDDKVIGVS